MVTYLTFVSDCRRSGVQDSKGKFKTNTVTILSRDETVSQHLPQLGHLHSVKKYSLPHDL